MPEHARFTSFAMHGPTGKLAQGVRKHWLTDLEKRNPAILSMLSQRDLRPVRTLLPWSGEFAGKHITGAYYIWRLTGDSALYESITSFIDRLIACQAEDGYLGCFSKECRLTGALSHEPAVIGQSWDAWNHYHIMFGLLKWHEATGNEAYLQCVKRIAALFISRFYNGNKPLVSIGSSEMNLSVIHAFVLLYEKTGDTRYLEFARNIEGDLPDPAAGDYMRWALDGQEFYLCPKPRWESLHVIMGLAEMHRATGEAQYLKAARQIFFSILKTDVHNTGGFSTREQAVGNPYEDGPIETCCAVAYNALASQILEMTGEIGIVEHLEASHYNAMLASFAPGGYWSTYNTPMDGVRIANIQDIGFQCRPGSPELNCCSVNAPRGVGQIYDWAIMQSGSTLFVNCYEPMNALLEDGTTLAVAGQYPYGANVSIRIGTKCLQKTVALRIPAWSKNTRISFRGKTETCKPGEYRMLTGVFDAAEEISLTLDVSPRLETGDLALKGKFCVHAGPILYGFDAPDNPNLDQTALDGFTREEILKASLVPCRDGGAKMLLPDGTVLRDFFHLGASGSAYRTWLPLKE